MIEITQGGVIASPGSVEALREEFQERGHVVIPGLLPPAVVNPILKLIERTQFLIQREKIIKGATRMAPADDPALVSLHFALNRTDFFATVSAISGIPCRGNFTCRLHRTGSAADEQIDWHDDGGGDRILGLNINLTRTPYSGGILQLRNPERQITGEIGQLPAGDAVLFRVGHRWDHRLTPVASGERTVVGLVS